jgi:hypothetical protein
MDIQLLCCGTHGALGFDIRLIFRRPAGPHARAGTKADFSALGDVLVLRTSQLNPPEAMFNGSQHRRPDASRERAAIGENREREAHCGCRN